MNLAKLNQYFQKETPLDGFLSSIWTERYIGFGDMELVFPATTRLINLLPEGVFIALDGTDEVMLVETSLVEDERLKLTGRTLELILADRVLRAHVSPTVTLWAPDDDLNGPAEAVADVVDTFCISGSSPAMVNQEITNLVLGDVDDDVISYHAPGLADGTVYERTLELAQIYGDVGFSLTLRNVVPATNAYELAFNAWYGRDLTSDQSTYPVVKFAPSFDSLTNISQLRSISGYKTYAYAFAPDYNDGVNPPSTLPPGVAYIPGGSAAVDFARREMFIEVSEATFENYGSTGAIAAYLAQKAADALADNTYTKILDGEIVPQSQYTYGTDFKLGDIVELDALDGSSQKARITEYIRTQDATGERSYPTVSVIS